MESASQPMNSEQKKIYDASTKVSQALDGLNYYEIAQVLSIIISFLLKDQSRDIYESFFEKLKDNTGKFVTDYHLEKNNL